MIKKKVKKELTSNTCNARGFEFEFFMFQTTIVTLPS
jgi:hypothetical protein